MQKNIDWSKKLQKEYTKCGQATDKWGRIKYETGNEIEKCVDDSLKSQGHKIVIAGETDAKGNSSIKQEPGMCGPLSTKGNEIHENHHSVHIRFLLQRYGRRNEKTGEYEPTGGFNRVRNSASDWWPEEVAAYGAEIPFYNDVINELNSLCCKPQTSAPSTR